MDFPDIFVLSLKKEATIAEYWNEAQRDWNLGLRRGRFDRELDWTAGPASEANWILFGLVKNRTKWFGPLNPQGSFTTKLAVKNFFAASTKLNSPQNSLIWKYEIPKKVKVFLWSLAIEPLILMIDFS